MADLYQFGNKYQPLSTRYIKMGSLDNDGIHYRVQNNELFGSLNNWRVVAIGGTPAGYTIITNPDCYVGMLHNYDRIGRVLKCMKGNGTEYYVRVPYCAPAQNHPFEYTFRLKSDSTLYTQMFQQSQGLAGVNKFWGLLFLSVSGASKRFQVTRAGGGVTDICECIENTWYQITFQTQTATTFKIHIKGGGVDIWTAELTRWVSSNIDEFFFSDWHTPSVGLECTQYIASIDGAKSTDYTEDRITKEMDVFL